MCVETCKYCSREGFLCEKPYATKTLARIVVSASGRQALITERIEDCGIRSEILSPVAELLAI